MGEVAAVREGLYWEHFNDRERELLRRAGVDPAESDSLGAIDGELALLRVLVLRILSKKPEKGDAETIGRLVERVGRVLRARQALTGGDNQAGDFLEEVGPRVLEHLRGEAKKEGKR
jgi:hypothetical protein